MKLENQCVSLELAKKLKELGVEQDSLFWWYQVVGTIKSETEVDWQIKYGNYDNGYSAFTVAELGEMLFYRYDSFLVSKQWIDYKKGEEWCCQDTAKKEFQYANTEANARAKCLIYLVESGIMKL